MARDAVVRQCLARNQSMKAKHWIADENTRRDFWSYTKDKLDLTEDQVYTALGIESIQEWSGTKREALRCLTIYMDKRLSGAVQNIPESPVVAWSRFQTQGGFEWSFTVRAGLDPALIQHAITQICDVIITFDGLATSNDWEPPASLVGETESATLETPLASRSTTKSKDSSDYQNMGEGKLKQVAVKPNGEIQLTVEGLHYPLKDSRGAKVVAGLFRDDCWTSGFSPTLLSQSGFYQPQGLMVKYGKNNKGYWDILEVRRVA